MATITYFKFINILALCCHRGHLFHKHILLILWKEISSQDIISQIVIGFLEKKKKKKSGVWGILPIQVQIREKPAGVVA